MELAVKKPLETVTVNERTAACEGEGGSALGHPKVYLRIGGDGHVDCPYCGRRFVLEAGAPDSDSGH